MTRSACLEIAKFDPIYCNQLVNKGFSHVPEKVNGPKRKRKEKRRRFSLPPSKLEYNATKTQSRKHGERISNSLAGFSFSAPFPARVSATGPITQNSIPVSSLSQPKSLSAAEISRKFQVRVSSVSKS